MPDLNLIDEGGFEDAPAPAAPPVKKKITKSGSGGGGTKILIIVLTLAIIGGVLWYLNQQGIVKLWGKKKAQIAQMQDEPFQQEPINQSAQEPIQETQQSADTSQVALVDTAPVEEKTSTSTTAEEKTPAESESISKLNEMSGEFTIQVIAYREKSKAIETANNLEYAGYPSFVEKIPMNGGDFYTVRIGKYPSREDAQKAVKSFAAQLQAHYVIDKVRNK